MSEDPEVPEAPEAPEAPEPETWLKQYEDAITQRLAASLAPLPVSAISEKSMNFIHVHGDALVLLAGIKPLTRSQALNTSVQGITLSYEVLLRSRSLKDHTGLYPMLAAALQSLLGFRPPGAEPLRLANSAPAGQGDGAWLWSLNFETDTVLVPCLEAETGPLFQSASFEQCLEVCTTCQ